MNKKFCRSSLSEEECEDDNTCTRVNNHSYHPFSILVDGEYVEANAQNCEDMHEEPYLALYEEQCGLMPPVLYGNTSFGKHYDPANSSPDKNFGIYKDCWNCIKKETNLDNIIDSLPPCLDLNDKKIQKYMAQGASVINKKVSEKRSGNVTLTRETDDIDACLETENIEDCI